MIDGQHLSKLVEALYFSAITHRDQRRKDDFGAPYINHPIEVLRILTVEAGITDYVVLCGAVLHDTIEDSNGVVTLDILRAKFGDDVAYVVDEVSDDKSLPKAQRKLMQIQHAGQCSHRAKLIKIADKICNCRNLLLSPPKGWDKERISDYFHWSCAVVEQVRGCNITLEHEFNQAIQSARSTGIMK